MNKFKTKSKKEPLSKRVQRSWTLAARLERRPMKEKKKR